MTDEVNGSSYARVKPRSLAELDEQARAMAEETGWGYEQCLVQLQAQDRGVDWGTVTIDFDVVTTNRGKATMHFDIDLSRLDWVEVDWPFTDPSL